MTQRTSAYLFSTAEQWNACLFAGADRDTRAARVGLNPQAQYSRIPHTIVSPDALAPALTTAGELLWHDGNGRLLRALPRDASATSMPAPWAIAHSTRMVIGRDAIWVAGAAPGTLECFELDTLARLQVVTIAGALVIDLAADAHDGLLILVEHANERSILQLNCRGTLTTLAKLDAELAPTQMANLPAHERILLLDQQGTRLVSLRRGRGTPEWTRQLGAFRPCFVARALASDGRGRVFLAGADRSDFGATPFALVLDSEATLIDAVQLKRAATGICGTSTMVVVSNPGGVDVHERSSVAGDSAAVAAELITPLLTPPDGAAEQKWQRVDAWATLPEGTTLELRYGWTENRELAARAREVLADERLPQSQRIEWLRATLDHWSEPVSFAGSAQRTLADPQAPPLAFPLHDARAASLWLHVAVRATPGSQLPALTRMSVSYAGSAMLQQLPAIYRANASAPGSFLGALVGTLEATSQDLDRRIGALGSLIHPDTASAQWLDEVAEWLGLPWDDALTLAQKRAIVQHASGIAAQRGTRGGLTALLESLFPGTPARFRISDVDVDFGFVTLGGKHCNGSALPAVLAGLPRSAAVLSRKAILGMARLPCAGAMPSATRELAGRIRIDMSVDNATRRAAQPWLERLVDSMVPANLRVELRWQTPALDVDPDGGRRLAAAPEPHLGVDAITGFARLPYGRASTLWS